MICIDLQENMSLAGDILEYEDYGTVVMDEEDIIIGAMVVIGAAIEAFLPIYFNRLRGGEAIVPWTGDQDSIGDDVVNFVKDEFNKMAIRGVQGARNYLADTGRAIIAKGKRKFQEIIARPGGIKRPKGPDAIVPPLRGGSAGGSSMLRWKNSLTRMYHTYQFYSMSPIMKTLVFESKYYHYTEPGNGPHLYWVYSSDFAVNTNLRNTGFGTLLYWDGGFAVTGPTNEVPADPTANPPVLFTPAKNFRTGKTGTIYIFAADWPGTVMNPDFHTYSQVEKLKWVDYQYQGTVTTPNYPRIWTNVFANTNWQYITVYGISYRLDVTNISVQDYTMEISLFKFKADIDAMNYEKQCLAHFGGYHFGTNGYCQKLNYMPTADVRIIQTKRYHIKGSKMYIGSSTFTEGDPNNSRTIRLNIKRRYVLKRPLLNSYETTLTEEQIFEKYYDKQKGIYMRIQAWPTDIYTYTNNTGLSGVSAISQGGVNLPSATDNTTPCTRLGNGLSVTVWKKAYFKLDENTASF